MSNLLDRAGHFCDFLFAVSISFVSFFVLILSSSYRMTCISCSMTVVDTVIGLHGQLLRNVDLRDHPKIIFHCSVYNIWWVSPSWLMCYAKLLFTGVWNNDSSTNYWRQPPELWSQCVKLLPSVVQQAIASHKKKSNGNEEDFIICLPSTPEEDASLDAVKEYSSTTFSSDLQAILAQNIVTYICE